MLALVPEMLKYGLDIQAEKEVIVNKCMEYYSFSQPFCMSYVALCEISSRSAAFVNSLWATIGDISASTSSWTNETPSDRDLL